MVAALYKFVDWPAPAAFQPALQAVCEEHAVRGTLLLATEGINGTIAGSRAGIDAVLAHIRGLPGCADLEHKEAPAPSQPFLRLKVRLKAEIITMGVPDINPARDAGTYVEPEAWNALIADPDVVVIDTRNDYEVAIGTFEGALNPQTATFSGFPDWAAGAEALKPGAKVAMFCTGGIRCEKATALLSARGIDEVYHLKGGILSYLERVPEAQSKWQGACFVFDERVAVGHGLKPSSHALCRACGWAVSEEQRAHPAFRPGVSCPRCIDLMTPAQRDRFAERQRQMEFAQARGVAHLGTDARPRSKDDLRQHAPKTRSTTA
ncbi:MAG: rhodanese-related sulfurtransferase [Pseudomonadota bacterium]